MYSNFNKIRFTVSKQNLLWRLTANIMKKTIFILLMCFFTGKTFATPTSYYYCGANGYCFYVQEYYNVNGSMGFTCNYAGRCTGGPFIYNLLPMSPQDPNTTNYSEASSDVYTTFSGTPGGDHTPTSTEIATADSAYRSATYAWINPANITWDYAKAFAQHQGWAIFALTVNGNPIHNTMSFDIWSITSQSATVQLYNTSTGHIDWTTTLSLGEGKNEVRNQNVTGYTGSYILRISSSGTIINRNVTLN